MLSTTARTRLGRAKHKARTDRSDLYDLLDAALVCHLGVVADGTPMVVPTCYGRIGDTLYLHGSTGARSLRAGGEACLTVTLLDGIVLARSAFHHSVNHRSAMVYGVLRTVTDEQERLAGLRALTEHLAPGRWDAVRPPGPKERAATRVLALALDEASVKVRTGPPVDDEEDLALPVWAGVLPVHRVFGAPETAPDLAFDLPVPDHVAQRAYPA
ncbi:pyridoxamine 5'-phosphate oxidase family protein [Nocardiopsis sp. LOL_012]|uniref:pyridoxamine 5'-phosphate oxidase family protein n=1 Tax=Nocardiopsis sp. LOL_012 TaxID=3345409 RepID=UPI003A84F956